ncbi:MAG: glycosyltransferase family 2 protein [Flavobacteriales bacterium]|nr:glycosyltransferase family 2 protein [Flavobacteriales bacterium]
MMSTEQRGPRSFQAPTIAPLNTADAPTWSVMIPTFNCASLLRRTLTGLLAQAPSAEVMQIEVVDDHSTKDDPEAVVREVGQGRVSFYRHPANVGAIANFNSCIQRSRGALVHILHGDDLIGPGFYAKMDAMVHAHPGSAMYATRCFFIDEEDVITWVSPRLTVAEAGTHDATPMYYANQLQFAGVVIRRSFYEQHGGFLPELVHTADWEMWCRAMSQGGCVTTSDVLASYRVFAANDTGRLMRTAENLRDRIRFAGVMSLRHDDFSLQRAALDTRHLAWKQYLQFQRAGDHEAAQANLRYWLEHGTPQERFKYRLKNELRAVFRR